MYLHHLEIPPLRTPPKWTLQILIFCLAQTRAPVLFFDINRYNRQIFRHSLRVPPREAPLSGPPKTKFLHDQTYIACVFYISGYFRAKHFDRAWGYHPPSKTSQMDPLKINFFNGFC